LRFELALNVAFAAEEVALAAMVTVETAMRKRKRKRREGKGSNRAPGNQLKALSRDVGWRQPPAGTAAIAILGKIPPVYWF
jgi:hypothetical protein